MLELFKQVMRFHIHEDNRLTPIDKALCLSVVSCSLEKSDTGEANFHWHMICNIIGQNRQNNCDANTIENTNTIEFVTKICNLVMNLRMAT